MWGLKPYDLIRQVLHIVAQAPESSQTMAIDTTTVSVTANTTLDEVLDAADDTPITIERNGVIYSLARIDPDSNQDIWKGYDPQAVIEMLEDFKHNPLDIDATEWVADVYREREEGSRSDEYP